MRDFTKPSTPQQQNTLHPREHDEAEHEIYDYPGEYDSLGEGDGYVRLRMEALQARHVPIQAVANVRGIGTGHLQTLVVRQMHRQELCA
ncbi:MAG: phage late control D family protein [Sterolibacteriaceae bacterium]|uniref:Phage late control D family protein n=1 Tax=Candidatus Methylophosphatis roskildensis TaxID=2899263 RepID=A0A9D7E113_9PROT|nr:phage late control D family protein [Candidatus Methylophosphatis roskildensis]MBK7234264.1 phage late control D family protein [Sterolibacteriaceae bacterium]